MMINIYTDGAYSHKRSQGGWAIYSPELNIRVANRDLGTTNNRMEMTAVLNALKLIKELPYKEYNIISDSKYVLETMKGNFMKNSNNDLWDQIYELLPDNKQINWIYIKAHTGEKNGNAIVDNLANMMSCLK